MEIIVASDRDGLLAVKEYGQWSLPWSLLPADMRHLRRHLAKPDTLVICGRGTWESMTPRLRALPGRVKVLSRHHQGELYVASLREAVECAENDRILIIGGAAIYSEALALPGTKTLYWTEVQSNYPHYSDVQSVKVFPLTHQKNELIEEGQLRLCRTESHTLPVYGTEYTISQYQVDSLVLRDRTSSDTWGYQELRAVKDPWLSLVREIAQEGHLITGRNGNTISVMGPQLRYDLSEGFPISVVKKGYPKAIFLESLWMFKGLTDAHWLSSRNVKIWDANSSRETLDGLGLNWREGDIGPGYGFQLRHWGAEYHGCDNDYSGQGVDQLATVVSQLRNSPESRRIIINLWNPSVLDQCALPPCHVLYQFRVRLFRTPDGNGYRGYLDCHLFQRSWDVFLGWNTTTAALWVHLLAASTNLLPGTLVHSITDAHLYQCHLEAVAELLQRTPRPLPKLSVSPRENPWDYQWEDLTLEGYHPLPPIKAPMVV